VISLNIGYLLVLDIKIDFLGFVKVCIFLAFG